MSERKVLIIVSVCATMLFDRSRPDLWEWVVTETSRSFPSGHATASIVAAITLRLRTAKTTKGSTAV